MFIHNDTVIDFEVCGSGDDTPLLFLHGWGGNKFSFYCFLNQLSLGRKCITLSFPPFGESTEPNIPWTIEDYGEVVKALLDRLEIEKVSIVAHSFGGRVAIYLASRYNSLVERMVFFSSAGIKPKRGIGFRFKILRYKALKKLGSRKAANCGSPDWRALSEAMKKTFSNIVNTYQEKDCKKIVCPTLLIWGEKDTETPIRMARKMKKLIPDCGLVIQKNAGHFAYLSESAKNIVILEEFLKKR